MLVIDNLISLLIIKYKDSPVRIDNVRHRLNSLQHKRYRCCGDNALRMAHSTWSPDQLR